MRARLKVSRAGVELIKSFEGLRTTAARLPDGRWTLGYSHTFSAREGATATQEDADALLRFDLLPIVDAINNVVLVPLNQNQFDALVSFCFNIGVDNFAASSVCKRINEGRMTEAAQAMDSWRSAEFNGQTYVLAPLIRRRAAEKNLFLTPEDTAGNAPSLLIRPVEDSGESQSAPSEVDAPNHGGILSAHPAGMPQSFAAEPAAPAATIPAPVAAAPAIEAAQTSFTPSFDISATPQPVPAAPERQVIDLSAFAPRPVETVPEAPAPVKPTIQVMADVTPAEAPKETVVEQLPYGLMSTGSVRETPAVAPVEQTPTSYDYDPTPAMSPDVQAALARAQDEQRLREETQRQAEALAAARVAEEARQREEIRLREEARLQVLQQQEMARLEQARLEQARLEQVRLEQEQRDRAAREEQMRAELARLEQAKLEQARLEQARLDQARLEQEQAERQRQDAMRLDAERADAVRAEQARAEQARLEQEQAERARQEAMRLDAERAEAARLEQARAEQARLEQSRLEQEQAERERQEAAQREQARFEEARLEQEKQAQAAAQAQASAAPAPSTEDIEKARKAEAAAALMRLYSPYGSGGLGRPLMPGALPKADAGPALEPTPAPRTNVPPPYAATPQQVPVQPVQTPEPPQAPARSAAPEEPDDDAEVQVVSETVSFAFKPASSASQMPPPQVTALNPYARPIPQAAESLVEVPRPAPVDMSAPSMAPQVQQAQNQEKAENLHWREQLQRPLPPGYQSSEPARPTVAPVQAAPASARNGRFEQAQALSDDDWTMDGDRIALSSEEMEEEAVSWWKMIMSTTWWILISAVGLGCLGGATALYFKATKDETIIRNGLTGNYELFSLIAATAGIFFVCVSVWLIMKRLGGLKE